MSSSDNLIKATINRLGARLSKQIIAIANDLSIAAQNGPERIKEEWDLFQEEVIAEADRLEKESSEDIANSDGPFRSSDGEKAQAKVDNLRAMLTKLNRKLEARS